MQTVLEELDAEVSALAGDRLADVLLGVARMRQRRAFECRRHRLEAKLADVVWRSTAPHQSYSVAYWEDYARELREMIWACPPCTCGRESLET